MFSKSLRVIEMTKGRLIPMVKLDVWLYRVRQNRQSSLVELKRSNGGI